MSRPPVQRPADEWRGETGDKWVAHADALDQLLTPYKDILLEAAPVEPGARLIDIGCGAGAVTLAFADRGAKMVGVDVSPQLLEVARQRAAGRVEFIEADASQWQPSAPLAGAVSRYGVMFFEEPVPAFENIRRAIMPGGCFTFLCWQAISLNPWALAPLEAAAPHIGGMPQPKDPHRPGPFAFADKGRVRGILQDAGWQGVEIEEVSPDIVLPGKTPEEAAAFALHLGPGSRLLREHNVPEAEVLPALTAALTAADGSVTPLGSAAFLVRATAQAPG